MCGRRGSETLAKDGLLLNTTLVSLDLHSCQLSQDCGPLLAATLLGGSRSLVGLGNLVAPRFRGDHGGGQQRAAVGRAAVGRALPVALHVQRRGMAGAGRVRRSLRLREAPRLRAAAAAGVAPEEWRDWAGGLPAGLLGKVAGKAVAQTSRGL